MSSSFTLKTDKAKMALEQLEIVLSRPGEVATFKDAMWIATQAIAQRTAWDKATEYTTLSRTQLEACADGSTRPEQEERKRIAQRLLECLQECMQTTDPRPRSMVMKVGIVGSAMPAKDLEVLQRLAAVNTLEFNAASAKPFVEELPEMLAEHFVQLPLETHEQRHAAQKVLVAALACKLLRSESAAAKQRVQAINVLDRFLPDNREVNAAMAACKTTIMDMMSWTSSEKSGKDFSDLETEKINAFSHALSKQLESTVLKM